MKRKVKTSKKKHKRKHKFRSTNLQQNFHFLQQALLLLLHPSLASVVVKLIQCNFFDVETVAPHTKKKTSGVNQNLANSQCWLVSLGIFLFCLKSQWLGNYSPHARLSFDYDNGLIKMLLFKTRERERKRNSANIVIFVCASMFVHIIMHVHV